MKFKCDVCGTTKDVQCEVFTKGEEVDRIYHLCMKHWVDIYRGALEDFVENNEYKVNAYLRMSADKMIVGANHARKAISVMDEEGGVDLSRLDPMEVRRVAAHYDDED